MTRYTTYYSNLHRPIDTGTAHNEMYSVTGQPQGIEVYLGSSHPASSHLEPKSDNLDSGLYDPNLGTWQPAACVHPLAY